MSSTFRNLWKLCQSIKFGLSGLINTRIRKFVQRIFGFNWILFIWQACHQPDFLSGTMWVEYPCSRLLLNCHNSAAATLLKTHNVYSAAATLLKTQSAAAAALLKVLTLHFLHHLVLEDFYIIVKLYWPVPPGISLPSPPRVSVSNGRDDKFCVLSCPSPSPTTFTVWKRSLFTNGTGYTGFDSSGNLVFRVDDYTSDAKLEQLILMDAAGNVLLTMRHKRLNCRKRWDAFRGDGHGCEKSAFSVIKSASAMFSSKTSAKVVLRSTKGHRTKLCDYRMKGRSLCKPTSSFTVSGGSGEIVAQATRKHATSKIILGNDVVRLVVQPGIDQTFVMGFLIIFDQIFKSESPNFTSKRQSRFK